MNVETFFSDSGPLAQAFESYEQRSQQVELAKHIEEAILSKTPMLGEAPTGVGKSLAALAPAFEAIRLGGKVLVVTSSIVLQEQYFYKDVPLMEQLFNLSVSPVLIKGKSNYLCLYKAMNRQTMSEVSDGVRELLAWAKQTKTGDVSELPMEPKFESWSKVSVVEESECAGKDCPFYAQCHYYRERQKMNSAKLIVCNYHYLFTAFKNRALLPQGITTLILDEGHEAASIARDMTEIEYQPNSYKMLNERLIQAQERVKHTIRNVNIHDYIELIPMLDSHQVLMMSLSEFYHRLHPKDKECWTLWDVEKKRIRALGGEHLAMLKRSVDLLRGYIDEFGLDQEARVYWDDYHTEEEIEWQLALERYEKGLTERYHVADFFFSEFDKYAPDPQDVERIVWIEPMNNNQVRLKAIATQAYPITKALFEEDEEFILNEATPILISATMTSNQQFDYLAKDLGVPSECIKLSVETPFNLTENMLWYLPKDIPEGNKPEHRQVALSEMERVIKLFEGRTLCLFTSTNEMKNAAFHLKKVLPSTIHVLVQGELPKPKIVAQLKENPQCVILGTRSFFTGVDIQGQNLSAVLIDKIPFPIAGDPLNEFLIQEEHGFHRYTLPETIIAIKQGFGRLNRTASDRGIVSILDGRLATMKYKNKIFNSFPFKMRATRDFQEVEEYARGILHDSSHRQNETVRG